MADAPPLDPHQATTLESDIDLRGVPTDGDLQVVVIERGFVVNAFAIFTGQADDVGDHHLPEVRISVQPAGLQ